MTSVIINAGPKLIPFFATAFLYFKVFIPHSEPGVLAALLKCLPIISLMIFVKCYDQHIQKEYKHFSKSIFWGLFFSCIGDLCLIWPGFFELGMVAFTVGHYNYINAFGFHPRNNPMGLTIVLLIIIGNFYLYPGFFGIITYGVPIYSCVIGTMMWRAIARATGQEATWGQQFARIGAICFVISDFVIAVDRFKAKIDNDQIIVMSTYYLAQLGIALSIVDYDKCQRNTD